MIVLALLKLWGKMKKISIFLALLLVCCFFPFPVKNIAEAKQSDKEFAKGYCVMEVSTGRVLAEGNMEKRLSMASTTKIITAILAIENNDLDKIIEVPAEAVGIEGSSIYLKKGEHLSVRELLLGLMLRSGNDAAVALAVDTFGSSENYQKEANNFARRLGLENTSIVTPNGLHDDNHYTSAYDLAVISAYALKNQAFREIVGTKTATISNELGKGKRLLKNKNKMLAEYDGATGIKTGFTKKAGRCLVSSAKRGDMELVCVVLGCPDWFNESKRLLDEAFENYKMVELLPEHYHIGKVAVKNGDRAELNLIANRGFSYPLLAKEMPDIRIDTDLKKNIEAPVCKTDVLGKISVFNKNELIFSENIYSIEETKSTKIGSIFEGLWQDFVTT